MTSAEKDTEKIRQIVSLLPGEHCGKCGFENCGKFGVALAEGKAKPTDCRQGITRMKELCEILGIEAPAEQELQAVGWKRGHHGHGKHSHGDRHHSHHGCGIHKGGRHKPGGHHSGHH